ncbi:hypothetical protein LEP1GSC060_2321 [Leptospira weilii serovar Ranarum str. ICFT]|uniref:Uncharacterized protein n=1 Tax=Leptospira weilii serovar Ranarum str. ICFT TaxID=1218598 RepID=N1WQH7_9LEPT|nr:hypothetical protein LEP1GSC060_2321 [Leptospira weilii serovar Ranarum str. ICFT]
MDHSLFHLLHFDTDRILLLWGFTVKILRFKHVSIHYQS